MLHQVAELPPARAVVTEHKLFAVRSPHCRARTRAQLPEGAGASHFGPRLGAFVAVLVGRFHLSRREVQALLDVPPSLGSVQAQVEQTSQALKSVYHEVRHAVRQSDVANVDETGWRLRQQRRWVWGAVTATAMLFRLRWRDSPDVRRLLGS